MPKDGWRFLDYDGYRTLYYRYNHETEKDEYNAVEDLQPLFDLTQTARNNESGNWKGDMHHVASIPPAIWHKWTVEFGSSPSLPENAGRLMEKLRDREFSKLRVKSGAI